MALTNREKILLFLLMLIITLSGYFHFLLFPKIDSIKEKSLVLEEEKNKIKKLENIDTKESLLKEVNSMQEKTKVIEASLPQEPKIAELYLEILDISDKTNIIQNELIIQETRQELMDNDELITIPIRHRFTSTYEGIKSYIEEVYNCERKIAVIEYEIKKSENHKLDADFLMYSYFLRSHDNDYTAFKNHLN